MKQAFNMARRTKSIRRTNICKGLLCILTAVFLISCGENETSRLLLNNSNMTMKVGDTVNLQAFYEGDESVSNLVWSSDQTAVATVNDGRIEAVGKGNAVISVMDENGVKAECNINVQEIEVESVKLNKIKTSVKVNKSIQLKADTYPEDASNQEVQWLSDDENIAIVNSTGLVTGKKAGMVNIICRSANGKEASCTVIVKKVKEAVTTSSTQNKISNQSGDEIEEHQPFYGIWCGAAKSRSEAEKEADSLRNKGLDAEVFLTTDWSNLNKEKWYVVTAGVYSSKSAAQNALSSVKKVYSTAYVKYSGGWQG